MEVIVLWAVFSLIVAIAAGARGRNGGFPYRVADDGSILAIMQGAKVKFGDMERFIAAVDR